MQIDSIFDTGPYRFFRYDTVQYILALVVCSCFNFSSIVFLRRGGDLHRQDARVRARAERVRNAWCGTVLPADAPGERLQCELVVAQGGCYFLGSHARGRFCHTI